MAEIGKRAESNRIIGAHPFTRYKRPGAPAGRGQIFIDRGPGLLTWLRRQAAIF